MNQLSIKNLLRTFCRYSSQQTSLNTASLGFKG